MRTLMGRAWRRVPAALVLLLVPALVSAQNPRPTKLLVRVLSHDAKVIGSGVGGARVTIRDAGTGRVLAEGVQEGSTGDTETIIRAPRQRGATVFDVGETASFVAVLDLAEPTQVEVIAEGPLGTEHAKQRGSKTLLMVPGVDIVGEGLVLELNGFTVTVDEANVGEGIVDVRAKVTMLCGCPTEPGGLWDADRFQVVAALVREGETVARAPLGFAGETSYFEGRIAPPSPGTYELRVFALDPARANTGMASRTVTVR